MAEQLALSPDPYISRCGKYRYALRRPTTGAWHRSGWGGPGPTALVLGINPSTAHSFEDDHTTRKLTGFAARSGWGCYWLANPFGLRSTDQRGLVKAEDPVGPENDQWIARLLGYADLVICAWGSAKTPAVRRLLHARLDVMRPILEGRETWCWGTSADGSPRHPLMLAYDTPLVRFTP